MLARCLSVSPHRRARRQARGRERIYPRAAELNMDIQTTTVKKIAALPINERRKLLEQAAECAAREYETDRELTAFPDHISTSLNFEEKCR